MKEEHGLKFIDYLAVVVKKRRFIGKTFFLGIMLTIIISVMMRNKYTATTTILPPNPQQDMMFGFVNPSMAASLGGYSGLTSLLSGGSGPSDLFAAILSSGRITGAIINKYDLKNVFKTRTYHDAAKQLEEITKIGVTPEGMISVSVTWYDKQLATDIANSYIEELDKFNTETAMTVGKKYRIFIAERLADNQDSLASAEHKLADFQKQHKTIALDVEIQMAIETIAKLKSEIILREVQKGAMSTGSGIENPYVGSIERELRELRKQLSTIEFGSKDTSAKGFGAGFSVPFSELPELSLEYARLLRDAKVQEALYELLTQQYEQAKIMELKDTPTVQVLDKASPPEKKSAPKRSRIVLVTGVFCLLLAVAGAFVLESIEQMQKTPQEYRGWIDIGSKIKMDAMSLIAHIRNVLRKQK